MGALQILAVWLRLLAMIFTHRPIRMGGGVWLQVRWGAKKQAIDAAIAAYLRNTGSKRNG